MFIKIEINIYFYQNRNYYISFFRTRIDMYFIKRRNNLAYNNHNPSSSPKPIGSERGRKGTLQK
jgi:hypothetical protein